MSGSTTLKTLKDKVRFYGLIVGFALIAFWTSTHQAESDKVDLQKRSIATITTKHSHKGHTHLTAIHKALDIDKKAANPIQFLLVGPLEGTKAGQPFTLTAKINPTLAASHATIKWALPKGVEIVKGAPQEALGQLSAGEDKEIEITLTVDVETNVKIHAMVYGEFGGSKLSRSAQFNTQLQDTINKGKEQLAKRNAEYTQKK